MAECVSCGRDITESVKFCPECGTVLDASASASAAAAAVTMIKAGEPQRKFFLPLIGGLAVVAAIGGGMFYANRSTEVSATEKLTGTFYASRAAKVRAKPTKDSNELGELARSMSTTGSTVAGLDGVSSWLKIESGQFAGGYVSKTNLVTAVPVELDTADVGDLSISSDTNIYMRPDTSSPVLTNATAGSTLVAVGKTTSGWIEIAQKTGGVGYIQAATVKSSTGSEEGYQEGYEEEETVTSNGRPVVGQERYVCMINGGSAYVWLQRVAMRYYPPLDKDTPQWLTYGKSVAECYAADHMKIFELRNGEWTSTGQSSY